MGGELNVDGVRQHLAHLVRKAGCGWRVDYDAEVVVTGFSDDVDEALHRCLDETQTLARDKRHAFDRRRRSRLGFDDVDALRVACLPKVEMQRRARIPNRASTRDLLRAVKMAEGRIVERRGKGGRGNAVLEDGMGLALAAAHDAAMHHRVSEQDVDGLRRCFVGAKRLDDPMRALCVSAHMLERVPHHEVVGFDDETLREKGQKGYSSIA